MKCWCVLLRWNTEDTAFGGAKNQSHLHKLKIYAWKPHAIAEAVDEFQKVPTLSPPPISFTHDRLGGGQEWRLLGTCGDQTCGTAQELFM